MSIKLGVVMDSIASLNYKKDTTLAMLWEAEARGWAIYYIEQDDLYLRDGVPFANTKHLTVKRDPQAWFKFNESETLPLAELDLILMRKDPPFNEKYIYTTYVLEQAERLGALVINKPQSLRDCNEKLFALQFPQCCPPTLVTSSVAQLHDFWREQRDIVCKPLDAMGGVSVFRLRDDDVNANVIFETLTQGGSAFIMAQRYIPEIVQGDKRIILINGEAVPYALVRIPQGNDWRGNLAVGAKGVVEPLTKQDAYICAEIGPELKRRGLYFVGIDVIGDYLTEINLTSPTGIQELDAATNLNISALLFDSVMANSNAMSS